MRGRGGGGGQGADPAGRDRPVQVAREDPLRLGWRALTRARAGGGQPEGDGCAERFIRTLEENLVWVGNFQTIEELRQAVLAFKEIYNTIWLIERLGGVSFHLLSDETSFSRPPRRRSLHSCAPITVGVTHSAFCFGGGRYEEIISS